MINEEGHEREIGPGEKDGRRGERGRVSTAYSVFSKTEARGR